MCCVSPCHVTEQSSHAIKSLYAFFNESLPLHLWLPLSKVFHCILHVPLVQFYGNESGVLFISMEEFVCYICVGSCLLLIFHYTNKLSWWLDTEAVSALGFCECSFCECFLFILGRVLEISKVSTIPCPNFFFETASYNVAMAGLELAL